MLGMALFLVFAAIFSYQTFGLAIQGLILGCGLLSKRCDAAFWRSLWAIPATLLAFAANVLLVRTRATDVLSNRTNLTDDWPGKVDWVVQELIPRVLWPFSLTPRSGLALLIVAIALSLIVISGMHARTTVNLRRWASLLGVVLGVAVFPMAPFLLIVENWASARAVLARH